MNRLNGVAQMAKEMESTTWAGVDHAEVHDLDQAALIAAILAQNANQVAPTAGPEWTSQIRPPAIPGTIQAKYAKMSLPVRGACFFVLWVTWDWKRGAFIALVAFLVLLIIRTR